MFKETLADFLPNKTKINIYKTPKEREEEKEWERDLKKSEKIMNEMIKDIRDNQVNQENEILFNWLSGFFPDFPREREEIIKYIRSYPEIELFYTLKIEGWGEREIKELLLRVDGVEIDRIRIIFELTRRL